MTVEVVQRGDRRPHRRLRVAVFIFQIQDVAAHRGFIELRPIAADARSQFPQIPRILGLDGGEQAAQFEQYRIADLRGIIRDGRNLGRAALPRRTFPSAPYIKPQFELILKYAVHSSLSLPVAT